MSLEADLLKRDLSKAETKEDVEKIIEDAETLEVQDVVELAKQKLAQITARAESVAQISPGEISQVETMGGSVDEVQRRTEGISVEINSVKSDAERQIAEVRGVVVVSEKPPIPPLPEKPAETATFSTEKTEDPKQKAFAEMQARFNEDEERKASDPENPVNKLIGVTDKTMKEVLLSSIRGGGKDISRFGINQVQLERALPDLYKRGLVDAKSYGNYILANSYDGNSIKMPEVSRIFESTPHGVILEIEGSNGMMSSLIDGWYDKAQAEIEKEKSSSRRNEETMLNLLTNAGRFSQKEEITGEVVGTVDSYLKNGNNIVRLRREDGTYPAIQNLYEMGFSDQGNKVLEKGLSTGVVFNNTVFEYQQKGYITEEQAKTMLDKVGRL